MQRCDWVNLDNEIYVKYHDEEWWVCVYDDRLFFEMLTLEWAQAWLSWETVLKRRESYKKAFDDFDVLKISLYNQQKIDELLQNPWIIRNKLKIVSTIKNAWVFIEIQKEFWSFSNYIWWFVWKKQIINSFENIYDYPTKTEISDKISKDLKKRWMSFVWSTIIYAFMQATWLVNDHQNKCFLCRK